MTRTMKNQNNWTQEQRQAIDWRGSSVLVSAGAGSGKTRVLVERIIKMAADMNNPEEIDRFLVVTFTNAAAAEMKSRIYKALLEISRIRRESHPLRRQQMLLNRASICTIHSFCMEVLKQYYYLLDLDPAFRIADQAEAELLRQQAVEEVLESLYLEQEEGGPFYQLVDAYTSERGDDALKNLVLKLYDFSRSHPEPRQWLRKKAEIFWVKDETMLENTPWVKILLKDTQVELQGMVRQISQAQELCSLPGGPAPYLDLLVKEKEMLKKCMNASNISWENLKWAVHECSFNRLKSCRGDHYEEDLKTRAKTLRDKVKNKVKSLQEDCFHKSLNCFAVEIYELAPLMDMLVHLVNSFEEVYSRMKREKGLVDFSDLEHYALGILGAVNQETGEITPAEAAYYYQEKYNYVMVDEYQDINLVQEAIIQLVSRGQGNWKTGQEARGEEKETVGIQEQKQERGKEPNVFMVGDVKQSIYRFRLAEPELFLKKMKQYSQDQGSGKMIRLNKNFRSRQEVLEGVNYLFRRIMDEDVGEINYDPSAELTCGFNDPRLVHQEKGTGSENGDSLLPEIAVISRSSCEKAVSTGEESSFINSSSKASYSWNEDFEEEKQWEEKEEEESQGEEVENAVMEARFIAKKIKEFTGHQGKPPFCIYCKKEKKERPVTFKDFVILLRSAPNWTSVILQELRNQEIPVYAEQSSGYFDAVEVEVVLSLLRVVDNPYQDIPLAAVLRSPLVGLSAEELAVIRAENTDKHFFDALRAAAFSEAFSGAARVQTFLKRLKNLQSLVHRGELGELIWQIYQETGYFEQVGGMERGRQRQANLRALYHRARQYESTSFRGLFRFLRFIEKLRDMGADLGPAPVLGEQENVVRIMTIHKSKGLEFPVVFLAGLGRQFNHRDLQGDFLLHKNMGFGPKRIDMEKRVVSPTLPFLAVKKQLAMEMLSEEMRILYVAMTRAEEKLFLVGSVNNIREELEQWRYSPVGENKWGQRMISLNARASAKRYLDWIGPAIICPLMKENTQAVESEEVDSEESRVPTPWKVEILNSKELCVPMEQGVFQEEDPRDEWLSKIKAGEPVPLVGENREVIEEKLSWRYPYSGAVYQPAKLSVSEIKNPHRSLPSEDDFWQQSPLPQQTVSLYGITHTRDKGMSPAERGTAYHTVMQRLDLKLPFTGESLQRQLERMVEQGVLERREKEIIDVEKVLTFFQSPLGERMKAARAVFREVPFTLSLPPQEILKIYQDKEFCQHSFHKDDRLVIQGVIDCLLEEEEGLVIIDYKSDRASDIPREKFIEKYRHQLEMYGRAVERIWKMKVVGRYLYFFDNGLILKIEEG